MPQLLSIGECFIEFSTSGSIADETSFDMTFSGDTLNVLAMATKLGTSCGYITRVSNDSLGDFLIQSWRSLGIDSSFVKQTRGFNAIEFTSPIPVGKGTSIYHRQGSAASTMISSDLDIDYIEQARILHVSGITQGVSSTCRQTVLEAVKIARDHNLAVSYDVNVRTRLWSVEEAYKAMDEVLPYVDIIFVGYPTESKLLFNLDSEYEIIDLLLSKGLQTVALICGEKGAWIGTPETVLMADAISPFGVVDTAGAGDTFAGAFLHCVNLGYDIPDSLRWAVASAGIKVGGLSIKDQPTREQVMRHLNSVKLQIVRSNSYGE